VSEILVMSLFGPSSIQCFYSAGSYLACNKPVPVILTGFCWNSEGSEMVQVILFRRTLSSSS